MKVTWLLSFRFQESKWRNIEVGDVVRLKKNDFIPVWAWHLLLPAFGWSQFLKSIILLKAEVTAIYSFNRMVSCIDSSFIAGSEGCNDFSLLCSFPRLISCCSPAPTQTVSATSKQPSWTGKTDADIQRSDNSIIWIVAFELVCFRVESPLW